MLASVPNGILKSRELKIKEEENEKRREILDILDKIKKVDFEPLETELQSHNINEKFLNKNKENFDKLTNTKVYRELEKIGKVIIVNN